MSDTDDVLVSSAWLKAHLADPSLRLIDGSYKMPGVTPTAAEDHARAHIPGAIFFDIDAIADHATKLPHMLPTAVQFARDVGALGIGDAHRIVIYDAGNWMGAPRVWWTFRAFGRNDVRILDGGLKKWLAEGGEVTSAKTTPAPVAFTAHFDAALVRSRAQMAANLAGQAEQVVDARSNERFRGAVAEPWPGRRSGRIPESFNVPFGILSDPATGELKSPAELRRAFEAAGIDLDRPVVTSCGSGVTAAALNVALARIGRSHTALYDGSWAEWGLPEGGPVQIG
jgi:thiosulfate/3-mercaptopyruvate sulfurtransferase